MEVFSRLKIPALGYVNVVRASEYASEIYVFTMELLIKEKMEQQEFR